MFTVNTVDGVVEFSFSKYEAFGHYVTTPSGSQKWVSVPLPITFDRKNRPIAFAQGLTVCTVTVGGQVSTGEGFCSTLDKPIKEAGRKVALTQALFKSGISRAARAQVWDRYKNRRVSNSDHLLGDRDEVAW